MKFEFKHVASQHGHFWQSDVFVYGDQAVLERVYQALRRQMVEGGWSSEGGLWANLNPQNGVLCFISCDTKRDPIHRINRALKFLDPFRTGKNSQNTQQ